jgi:glycosyltransferase involved in cell wall biosynthesis
MHLTMPKKVLIITYYWPPSGGSGVQRWAYFAKYLKEIGECEPIVVTVHPSSASYPVIDESLKELTKGIRVIRTKSFDLLKLYAILKGGKSTENIPQGSVGDSSQKSLFDRLSLYIRANFFIPDARIGWNKYALKSAQKLIDMEGIKLVITSGPPHSTHLTGLKLKKDNNIQWIADFRDPWREVYYNEIFKRSKRADQKDIDIEKQVLETADFVTTVGPSLGELLESKIKGDKNKVKIFYNGFDHDLLKKVEKEELSTFTIAQIGVFSAKQPYKAYLEFLKSLAKVTPFNLELAGNIEAFILEEIRKIKGVSLKHHGKVSHAKAIAIMKSAHLLTNCLPSTKEAKLIISGKLMEYISTGNPIMVIGDKNGDAGKLIGEAKAGKVFDANEIQEMVDFALFSKDNIGKQYTEIFPSQYTRENITKSLSRFLHELLP